jgi:hypothetical protein
MINPRGCPCVTTAVTGLRQQISAGQRAFPCCGRPLRTQSCARTRADEPLRLRISAGLRLAYPGNQPSPARRLAPYPLPGEGPETDETELHRSAAWRPGRGSSRAMRFAVAQHGLGDGCEACVVGAAWGCADATIPHAAGTGTRWPGRRVTGSGAAIIFPRGIVGL